MAKPPPPPRPAGSPDSRFRKLIEAAVADGVAPDDMTLRLTLRDANLLSRDPSTPVADISYAGGAMRFLGVRIEKGGVPDSTLDRGTA
jgi:hypothetical protein